MLRVRPNPVQPVVAFWEAMVTALLLRGNAFATLTRDDDGRVRALWYVNPDRVTVEVTKTGRAPLQGRDAERPDHASAEGGMLHITGPMSEDGYTGRSASSRPSARRSGSAWRSSATAAEFFRERRHARGAC